MDDGSQKLVDNEFGEGKICNNGVKIASILDLFYDIIISSVWWSAEYGFFFHRIFSHAMTTMQHRDQFCLGLQAIKQYNWDLIAKIVYIRKYYLYQFMCMFVKNSVGSGSWHVNKTIHRTSREMCWVFFSRQFFDYFILFFFAIKLNNSIH